MQLENQIKETFYKAMSDSLEERIVKKKIDNETVDWLVELCNEIKERINNLTPSRRDLHEQLNKSMDTQLLKQMLQHAAFEEEDVHNLVSIICERLKMLCAPSQDAKIQLLEQELLTLAFEKCVPKLILETNKFIDDIDDLHKKFIKGVLVSE